ncbi:MAG: hypothetical protein WA814_04940 [Candidatus Baltobacteraceae bacterium]
MVRLAKTALPLLLACGVALAACSGSSGSSRYGAGDPELAAANPGGGPIDPFLTDGPAVLSALDAIAQRSGRPLRVTSMNADTTNGLSVDVQEPSKHVNVDRYVVAPDGSIAGPSPVKLMSLGGGPISAKDVDARAFDPRAIAFGRLTRTARDAIARSQFADARVSQWELDGIGSDDRRFIYLEAARGRPAAEVNPKLEIVRMSF